MLGVRWHAMLDPWRRPCRLLATNCSKQICSATQWALVACLHTVLTNISASSAFASASGEGERRLVAGGDVVLPVAVLGEAQAATGALSIAHRSCACAREGHSPDCNYLPPLTSKFFGVLCLCAAPDS